MKRKFITNLAFLLLLNLLIKPFWVFGIDRTVQNTVGTSEYGWYYALFNLSLVFNILLDIGITTFNNREIAQDHSRLGRYLVPLLSLKFALSILYTIIVLLVGLALGYQQKDFHLLYLLILNQFLASFILYLRSNISGLQKFMTDSAISVMDRTLVIIICGYLLWSSSAPGPFRIEWFILSQTLAYSLTLIFSFLIVISHSTQIRLRIDLNFSFSLLKRSVPFAMLFLLMALYNWTGPVMIKKILGAEGDLQTGIYAHAFRLIDFLSMFGFLMSGILLPMFAHMLHKGESIDQLVKFSFVLIFIPSFILAATFLKDNMHIMNLLYHENINESAKVFSILMIGFPAISTSYIFGTLLTANGNLRLLNIVAASMMLFSLLSNLLLIPVFKASGAALAYTTSQLISAVLQVYFAQRIFKFEINLKLLIRIVVFLAIFIVMVIAINVLRLNWMIGLTMEIGVGILLSFVIGLFDMKEIILLFREGLRR